MSSNPIHDEELARLLQHTLTATPSVNREEREELATQVDSLCTSLPALHRADTDTLQIRINRLSTSDDTTGTLEEEQGTSRRTVPSLFVDVNSADRNSTGLSSDDELQMWSARSVGGSTIDSAQDPSSSKFDIYRFPVGIKDMASICCQRQSGSVTACIRTNCKFKHKGPKINFEPGTIVGARSAASVFIDLTTHNRNISSTLFWQWQRKARTMEEWSECFQVVNQGPSEVFTPEAMEAAQVINWYAKDFRSPTRGVLLEDLPFGRGFSVFQDLEKDKIETENAKFDTKHQDSIETETDGDINPERLKLLCDINKSVISAIVEKLDETSNTINEELRVLLTHSQRTEAMLGQRVAPVNVELQAPSVWGTIALLADMLESVKDNVGETASTTAEAFAEMDRNITELKETLSNQLQTVVFNATNVISDQLHQVSSISHLNSTAIDGINSTLLLLARGAHKLKEEIHEIRVSVSKVVQKNSPSDGSHSTAPMTLSTTDSSMANDIENLKGMIRAIDHKVDNIIEGKETKSVKFFGLTFRGHSEAETWVTENLNADTYALIVDVHSVFDLNVLFKIKIDNITQGLAISSFDHPMPKFFSVATSGINKKPKLRKPDSSHFDNIDNWEAWDMPITGFRAKLKEHVEDFEQTHLRMIRELVLPEELTYRIATMSVQASVSWILSFIAYVDETYLETVRLPSFTPARAWQLVTQIARRILNEVAVPRNGVKKLFRVGDNAKIAMVMFDPMVMCHDIMNTYKRANYKDHPSAVGQQRVYEVYGYKLRIDGGSQGGYDRVGKGRRRHQGST